MQQQEMSRLKHFILAAPSSIEEVTECIQLALERAKEISFPYMENLEAMPDQLAGELNTLRELVETAFQCGEQIMCTSASFRFARSLGQVTIH